MKGDTIFISWSILEWDSRIKLDDLINNGVKSNI